MAFPPSTLQPIGLRHGIRHCPGGDDPMPCVNWNCYGDVFFVNGITGSDLNDGKTPDSPFKTIRHALDQCVDGHNDIIYVLDCWQQDVFPIVIDKYMVHIIGCGGWNGMPMAMTPTGDTAIFQIDTKGYNEIANFQFGAGATHAPIEFVGTVTEARTAIHDCWFGTMYPAQDGIRVVDNKDAVELFLQNNRFGRFLTRDGVRFIGTSTRSIIRDNIFRRVGGVGVNVLKAGSTIGAIIHNKFSLTAATKGKAISFVADTSLCFIDQNSAMFGNTLELGPGATNPYLDLGSNDWGCNYAQCAIQVGDGKGVCQCLMPETT